MSEWTEGQKKKGQVGFSRLGVWVDQGIKERLELEAFTRKTSLKAVVDEHFRRSLAALEAAEANPPQADKVSDSRPTTRATRKRPVKV